MLKNDVSKLSGFEFGKEKTIGHLEELSPETEAFLLANGMGSSNDFLQLDWGTVKVTLKDDEILIYWSFNDDQTQYVMNIRGKYEGESYSELEMMFAIPGLTYYEKYYIDEGKPAELVAYIQDFVIMKMTSFNRIERNGDAYNSYSVNKNGDSYIPTEIALMDSTGGAVFTSGDGFDSYYFVDTDCAVMEKIEYLRNDNLYQENFATRYLELLPGHTLEYCDGSGDLPDMLLDDENISYEQSSSDEVHYYTAIYLGQKDALLDADLAGTVAAGKLRFLKHDLVHSLKAKIETLLAGADNPALYTGLDKDYILGLKDEVAAWSATLN